MGSSRPRPPSVDLDSPPPARGPDTRRSPRLLARREEPGAGATPGGRRRARPGVRALREVRRLQRTTGLLVPKVAFSRVVREVATHRAHRELMFQAVSLLALQEATEAYIVMLFEVRLTSCIL